MAREYVAYGDIQTTTGKTIKDRDGRDVPEGKVIAAGDKVSPSDVGGKETFDNLVASGSIVPKLSDDERPVSEAEEVEKDARIEELEKLVAEKDIQIVQIQAQLDAFKDPKPASGPSEPVSQTDSASGGKQSTGTSNPVNKK